MLATIHCLLGCSIGEIIGMSVGVALGWDLTGKMMLSVPLAFITGYILTTWGMRSMGFMPALKMALASDTISIAVMEIVDSLVMIVIPRSMSSGFSVHYWFSLAVSLTITFIIATPINKLLMDHGLGHQHMVMDHHESMDHMDMR
jgi:hypothetical protein